MQVDALDSHLKLLKPYLDDSAVSEIIVNKPFEVYVEKSGMLTKHIVQKLSLSHLNRLASLIANFNKKPFGENYPRLSAKLPQGHRVQVIAPPIVEEGLLALSIRKQVIANVTLNSYPDEFYSGCHYKQYSRENGKYINKTGSGFGVQEYISKAIKNKKTILVSGGTSTGKTTFLNACLKKIPSSERLIVLEDTREVVLSHPNHLCLVAGHNGEDSQKKDMDSNLKASLRLRPDRIIVGELRAEEAATFLEAASTGHDGSFATIHASNPNLAIERLACLCEKAGMQQQTHEALKRYISQIIDVVIQVKRDSYGRRYLSEVWSFE